MDEECNTGEDAFNVHNSHIGVWDNPCGIRELGYQVRFNVSIWHGMVGEIFMGPSATY
jgi:hypothetical protein